MIPLNRRPSYIEANTLSTKSNWETFWMQMNKERVTDYVFTVQGSNHDAIAGLEAIIAELSDSDPPQST